MQNLFGSAALVNRGEREASGETAGCGSGVNPCEFEGDQGEREVFGSGDEATVFGIGEDGGDARLVEGLEQNGFLVGPFVSGASSSGYQAGDRAAGDFAGRLHQHLQVVAVGEAPKNLADTVIRQGAQAFGLDSWKRLWPCGTSGKSTLNFQGTMNKCSVTGVIGEGDVCTEAEPRLTLSDPGGRLTRAMVSLYQLQSALFRTYPKELMLVFVDESGDSGMTGKPGSSALFVMVAVIFEDPEDGDVCDKMIDGIRARCFKNEVGEFHFTKCCDAHREAFLSTIAGADFFYLAFVLNKAKLYGPGFAYKESFYKYTAKLLFENAKPYLREAKGGHRQVWQSRVPSAT